MLAYFIRMHLIILSIFLIGIITPKQTYGLTWETPSTTFAPLLNGRDIDLSADPYGNAFTAYIRYVDDLDIYVVEIARFSNAAEVYEPPVTLASGDNYSNISVATNATTTALCIWKNDPLDEIDYSFFNGTTWGPSTLLTPGGFECEVKMNNLGNGLAAWSTDAINVSFFNGGTQTWGPPQIIPGSSGEAFVPKIAFNDAGNAIVIWSDFASPQLFASIYDVDLNVWSSPTTFGTEISSYKVGMDAAGNAVAVWDENATSNIFAVYYTGSWGAPFNISAGIGFLPSLGMSANGAAVVAWFDDTDGYYSQLIAGTWTAPSLLALNATNVVVALDSTGNALFTWNDYNVEQTFSIYKPLGGPLGTPDPVTEPSEDPITPTVAALSDNGRGFVDGAINPGEGSGLGGNYTLLEIFGRACIDPNTGARVRFLAWAPFNDSGLVAYYLKRNGVLMAVNLATAPRTYYDWDRNIEIEDTYSICGVDEFGNELSQRVIVLQ